MIGKERLAGIRENVAHMHEVRLCAELLNVALPKRYGKTSDLYSRSRILERKAVGCLIVLADCESEPVVGYLIERIDDCMKGMSIIEDCLLEFYIPESLRDNLEYYIYEFFPEDIRAALEDWITKLNYQEDYISVALVSEEHVSENEI